MHTAGGYDLPVGQEILFFPGGALQQAAGFGNIEILFIYR